MIPGLLVFAKAPRPGEVKTRLAAQLGAEAACEAYCRLLYALTMSLGTLEEVTVMYSPAGSESELRPFFPPHWEFHAQGTGDLGERLLRAFHRARPSIVIGSDCPYVEAADIISARDALNVHDVVFGPARDGGYWLIGARRIHPRMFEGVDWGRESVLEQNLRACRDCGLSTSLLRTLEDVDTIEEWRRFEETLPRRKPGLP